MFERFARDVRRAVLAAAEEATTHRGDPRLGTEHLLYGLAAVGDQVTAELGITPERVHDELIAWDLEALGSVGLETGPEVVGAVPSRVRGWRRFARDRVPFTEGAKSALMRSLRICTTEGHRSIGTSHLLASLAVGGPRDPAVRLLYRLGLDPAVVEGRARSAWS